MAETVVEDPVQAYLASLVKGRGIELRELPDRGRGLFATAAPEGEPPLVFAEGPLGGIVQRPFSVRVGLACELCGHVLGSPSRQLRLLAGKGPAAKAKARRSKVAGPRSEVLEEPLSEVIFGEPLFTDKRPLFCSASCRDAHERCLGRLRGNMEATRRFAAYAKEVNCSFHLLVLKLVCWALAEAERTSPDAAAAPLRALHRRPYWDTVDVPANAEEARKFREKLRHEAEQARQLAATAIGTSPPLPEGWDLLSEAGYAGLLGALCCNAIDVVYVSPLVQHILQVDAMVECPAKAEAIAALEPHIRALQDTAPAPKMSSEDEARTISWQASGGPLEFSTALIPPFRGYAVFPRLSLVNHSCSPTCAVEFTFGAALFVVAQSKDAVRPGEELSISYLDASLGAEADHEAMGRRKRRRLLRPYGFECSCELCKEAAGIDGSEASSLTDAIIESGKRAVKRHRASS